MPEAAPELRACEFFAGMGLVRDALESGPAERRFRTVFANDFDDAKARMYRARFRDAEDPLIQADVASLAPVDIPPADLWTASFPCTDLSLAGRGAGIHAGQSGAVWAMLDLLRRKAGRDRPRWLLFENVPALLTSHGGADLRALVEAINGLGYAVDPLLVSAARFTPQSRLRLFLIASPLGEGPLLNPAAAPEHPARPPALRRAAGAMADLAWRARPLPELPDRAPTLDGELDALAPDDPRWWPEGRAAYFMNQIHPAHRALAERLIAGPAAERRPAFRRVRAIAGEKRSLIELRDDGLAGCLRTPKGGSAKQIVFEAGRGERRVRFMTSREAARLQGVSAPLPEGFSETELLFALGDAVCVPAARWVLDAALQEVGAPCAMATLEEHPRRSAPASIIATASS